MADPVGAAGPCPDGFTSLGDYALDASARPCLLNESAIRGLWGVALASACGVGAVAAWAWVERLQGRSFQQWAASLRRGWRVWVALACASVYSALVSALAIGKIVSPAQWVIGASYAASVLLTLIVVSVAGGLLLTYLAAIKVILQQVKFDTGLDEVLAARRIPAMPAMPTIPAMPAMPAMPAIPGSPGGSARAERGSWASRRPQWLTCRRPAPNAPPSTTASLGPGFRSTRQSYVLLKSLTLVVSLVALPALFSPIILVAVPRAAFAMAAWGFASLSVAFALVLVVGDRVLTDLITTMHRNRFQREPGSPLAFSAGSPPAAASGEVFETGRGGAPPSSPMAVRTSDLSSSSRILGGGGGGGLGVDAKTRAARSSSLAQLVVGAAQTLVGAGPGSGAGPLDRMLRKARALRLFARAAGATQLVVSLVFGCVPALTPLLSYVIPVHIASGSVLFALAVVSVTNRHRPVSASSRSQSSVATATPAFAAPAGAGTGGRAASLQARLEAVPLPAGL